MELVIITTLLAIAIMLSNWQTYLLQKKITKQQKSIDGAYACVKVYQDLVDGIDRRLTAKFDKAIENYYEEITIWGDKLNKRIDILTARLEEIRETNLRAMDQANQASIDVGVLKNSTHRVQYVPVETAKDLVDAYSKDPEFLMKAGLTGSDEFMKQMEKVEDSISNMTLKDW